jgi:transposase
MSWSAERFIRWAHKIGSATGQYVERILEQSNYPEQAYKSCLGIINLGKKYTNERLEKACARGVLYGKYSYRTIDRILVKKLDQEQEQEQDQQLKLPLHDNIRGGNYYE